MSNDNTANMDLMVGMGAQALSVYDETGLTPRQLAEQRGELLNALQHIAGTCDGRAKEVAAVALAKVEAKP